MANLVTQNIVAAGTAPTYATPTATTGDTVEVGNGVNTFLHVKNGSAAPVSVVIAVPGTTSYGEDTPDPSISVAAGADAFIPLRKEFADAEVGVGRAKVTVSAVTDVEIAAVRLG